MAFAACNPLLSSSGDTSDAGSSGAGESGVGGADSASSGGKAQGSGGKAQGGGGKAQGSGGNAPGGESPGSNGGAAAGAPATGGMGGAAVEAPFGLQGGVDFDWALQRDADDIRVLHVTLDGDLYVQSDTSLLKIDGQGQVVWERPMPEKVLFDSIGGYLTIDQTTEALPGFTNLGGTDYTVHKFAADGSEQWAVQGGTPANDDVTGFLDATDHLYLVGHTSDALPGFTSTGGTDYYVANYSPEGVQQWADQGGSDADDSVQATLDSSGRLYVLGRTLGSLPGFTNAGGVDYFLISYAADGSKNWADQNGGLGDDAPGLAPVPGSDAVYVAGTTSGDLNGQALEAPADNLFVVRYDSTGGRSWTRLAIPDCHLREGGVTDDGTLIIVGSHTGAAFVARFDREGSKLFADWYDSSGSASIDSLGNVMLRLWFGERSPYYSYWVPSVQLLLGPDNQVRREGRSGHNAGFYQPGTPYFTDCNGDPQDSPTEASISIFPANGPAWYRSLTNGAGAFIDPSAVTFGPEGSLYFLVRVTGGKKVLLKYGPAALQVPEYP